MSDVYLLSDNFDTTVEFNLDHKIGFHYFIESFLKKSLGFQLLTRYIKTAI